MRKLRLGKALHLAKISQLTRAEMEFEVNLPSDPSTHVFGSDALLGCSQAEKASILVPDVLDMFLFWIWCTAGNLLVLNKLLLVAGGTH